MKKAFTMAELLIVIGIIGLLAAMITVVATNSRDKARETLTRQRIEAVIQGLLAYQSDGSLALSLQSGPLAVSTDNGFARSDNWTSILGSPPSTPYIWDAPYGRGSQDYVTGPPKGVDRLSNFNPQKTIELLYASGVMIDPRTQERSGSDPSLPPGPYSIASELVAKDRSNRMAWNDAWGNPIIVGYAVYQTKGDAAQRAKEVRAYGFNRAVYLSAGAIGKARPASISYSGAWIGTTGILRKSWETISGVVNSKSGDGAVERYLHGAHPWGGIEVANGSGSFSGLRCFLSAPQEVK